MKNFDNLVSINIKVMVGVSGNLQLAISENWILNLSGKQSLMAPVRGGDSEHQK